MIAIVDVGYKNDEAEAACIVANDWTDKEPVAAYSVHITDVADYSPGEFYQRELPCLLKVLDKLPSKSAFIVIDGFVTLNPEGRPGLGSHLFEELRRETPIIGVAKTGFATATHAIKVYRGESQQPLYVTAVGVDANQAADFIRSMHGNYRIPTLLKCVDQFSRECGCW